jgi:hypothetical protein
LADFEIRGAEDIGALVKRINTHADSKALKRELNAGLNRSTKDVRGELSDAIPDVLPESGGLAATFKSATKFNTSAKSGKWAGVTIWGRARGHDVRTLTGRRLRHPLFGNRRYWFNQTAGVNPGALEDRFEDQKRDVQRDVVRVMEEIGRKVEH